MANGSFASLADNVHYKTEEDFAVLIRLVDFNNQFKDNFIFIDEHAYNFLSKSQLFGGEIIISNVGANVGTVFRCPALKKYKMALAPNSIMVKFNGCNEFYYYWLISPAGQGMLKSIVTGSAQPKFNKTNFRSMAIPVPPIQEQRKIADILSSLDDKIETNRKINARLEELVQALFKSWFIDFEPFGGEMPGGWKIVDFDDVIEVIAGGTPKTDIKEYWDGDIPWISVKDFVNEPHFVMQTERFITNEGLTHSSTHLLQPFDTIISARGTVGATAQIQEPMAFNQSCFGLRCKLNNGSHWLYFLMHHMVAELKQKSHGSVFDTINRKTLSDIKVIVPTDEVLSEFQSVVSPIINESLSRSLESARLAELRDALLPKLMSGEIKVG